MSQTLATSTLGSKAHKLNLYLMVGSFHGHMHNWKCQLDWYPLYIYLKNQPYRRWRLWTCIVFSTSNDLARAMYHSSHFHQHQAIKQHFFFWNRDKYEALYMSVIYFEFRHSIWSFQLGSSIIIIKKLWRLFISWQRSLLQSKTYCNC